jgi:hypothetical protein
MSMHEQHGALVMFDVRRLSAQERTSMVELGHTTKQRRLDQALVGTSKECLPPSVPKGQLGPALCRCESPF